MEIIVINTSVDKRRQILVEKSWMIHMIDLSTRAYEITLEHIHIMTNCVDNVFYKSIPGISANLIRVAMVE